METLKLGDIEIADDLWFFDVEVDVMIHKGSPQTWHEPEVPDELDVEAIRYSDTSTKKADEIDLGDYLFDNEFIIWEAIGDDEWLT